MKPCYLSWAHWLEERYRLTAKRRLWVHLSGFRTSFMTLLNTRKGFSTALAIALQRQISQFLLPGMILLACLLQLHCCAQSRAKFPVGHVCFCRSKPCHLATPPSISQVGHEPSLGVRVVGALFQRLLQLQQREHGRYYAVLKRWFILVGLFHCRWFSFAGWFRWSSCWMQASLRPFYTETFLCRENAQFWLWQVYLFLFFPFSSFLVSFRAHVPYSERVVTFVVFIAGIQSWRNTPNETGRDKGTHCLFSSKFCVEMTVCSWSLCARNELWTREICVTLTQRRAHFSGTTATGECHRRTLQQARIQCLQAQQVWFLFLFWIFFFLV